MAKRQLSSSWVGCKSYCVNQLNRAGKLNYLVVGIAVLAVALALLYLHQFGYNSDDVAEQTIIHSIIARGVKDTWLPPDPWLLKYPLYLIIDLFGGYASRSLILLNSIIMNSTLVLLLFVAAKYFFRVTIGGSRKIIHWLIFIWIFTLAPGFVGFLRMPNSRNFELGILLLLAALAHYFYYRGGIKVKSPKFIAGASLVAVFNGLYFYSDPYGLVFLCAFIVTFLAIEFLGKRLRTRKALVIVANVTAAVLVSLIIKYILDRLGFFVYKAPTELLKPTELGSKLVQLYKALMYNFAFEFPLGADNILRTFIRVLNQGLGLVTILGAVLLVIKYKTQKSVVTALALQPLFVMAAFVVTKNTDSIGSARYLLLLFPYLAITSVLYVIKLKPQHQRIIVYVVSFIIACNFMGLLIGAAGVANHKNPLVSEKRKAFQDIKSGKHHETLLPRNDREFRIIEELNKRNLRKGYGHYWESLVVNYLSDYKIETGQIICDKNGFLRPFYWVVQDKVFTPTSNQPTFLIFNSVNINHTACNLKELGPYSESITIDEHTVIFIYNYDVSKFFPKKDTLSKPR